MKAKRKKTKKAKMRTKKPKKVLRKKKSMAARVATKFAAQSFFKAKIKVIGIGGGGSSIVSEIGRSLHKATFVAADTDMRAFKRRLGIKQFLFGQELTHGLGTGLNTDLAKAAAESEKDKIAKLFEGQDIVIFIACLGGGLGSGATQVFAEVAKNFSAQGGSALGGGDPITFGIFTLPFKFEGKNKYGIAAKALRGLRKSLNVSITIPNERIFKIIEASTAITDAFSTVNRQLIESLESLIDLIYSPGVINIDFADLRAILQGRGNLAFLNTIEASGQDRAGKIVAEILNNPLYQNTNFTVEKVLFNIASSGSASMFEVDKISRAIAEHHEGAKIIFGLSKDLALKNRIKTTLLMAGPGAVAPAKPAVKKAIIKKERPKVKVTKPVREKITKKKVRPRLVPIPVFNPVPIFESAAKLTIINTEAENKKQAIRRNALEAKAAQSVEEQKKSEQEKEWEIPAFLRKIKIK